MRDPVRRDNLLTIIGLSLMSAVFVFAVYLPGHRASITLQEEIAAAEQTIREVPIHVARLESLHRDLESREAYLKETAHLIPDDAQIPAVVGQVARLGRNCDIEIRKLEPIAAIPFATYQSIPVRLNFRGTFRSFLTFIKGLEAQSRLFAMEELTVRSESEGFGGLVEGVMVFHVYANIPISADFSDKADSTPLSVADTQP